ncbi:beta-lactamase class A [Chitinophaga skermanii]|uniref:beta-lactamase n=1 Tax=Chitinophaga skermanii TaxID=331697 RepID=A0A327QMQ9_9BACT|nr:serine hydrolase [Chitinophaga skermanii]RAJ05328.1 beta-lactamase class A [Chitinophaga skermanii]
MNTRSLLLLLLSWVAVSSAQAQQIDRKLTEQLQPLLRSFQGRAGIYVENLSTGKIVQINADTVFPTASMVKIPIMVGIFQKIAHDSLTYHQALVYRDSLLYEGEDILGSFKDSEQIQLSKVMMLMLTMSDNTASLWLQSLAGGGQSINNWLGEHGYTYTRVNSRTPGRQANRELYGWGQTTPREMATLMKSIYQGKVINKTASERMYRNLTRNFWDTEGAVMVPANVRTATKNGMVDASRSEVILVNAPHGDYVYCLQTKNNTDQRWERNNEAWVLMRQVAALLWKYYEPKGQQGVGSLAEQY